MNRDQIMNRDYNYWLKRCTKSRTGEIKLKNGNTVVRPYDGITDTQGNVVTAIVVRHWATPIIFMFPNGQFRLQNRGWYSVTTKARLEEFSPARLWGWDLASQCGYKLCRFFDGIEIDSDGDVINAEWRPNESRIYYESKYKIQKQALGYVHFLLYLVGGSREDGLYHKNIDFFRHNLPSMYPVSVSDGIVINLDGSSLELRVQTGVRGGWTKATFGLSSYGWRGGVDSWLYGHNNTLNRIENFMRLAEKVKEMLPKEWIEFKLTNRSE